MRQWFTQPGTVLEIGAGTGQHAVHFAAHLPHLQWQPTDREENLAGIGAWVSEAALPNLRAPLQLDVRDSEWPVRTIDYVFSANTAHIMSWPEVELMFAGVGRVAARARRVLPVRPVQSRRSASPASRTGRSTQSLRARDPKMGIRDDQALKTLGRQHGLDVHRRALDARQQPPAGVDARGAGERTSGETQRCSIGGSDRAR